MLKYGAMVFTIARIPPAFGIPDTAFLIVSKNSGTLPYDTIIRSMLKAKGIMPKITAYKILIRSSFSISIFHT